MPLIVLDPTTQFLIPFLFVLAIVFGVLELSNIFKNRAVSAIIAIAIAGFASLYAPFVEVLWNLLPSLTWFFIVLFLLAFTLELFGVRRRKGGPQEALQSMLISGVILIILFGVGFSVIESLPIDLPFIGGGQNLLVLLGIIFIIAIFWSAFRVMGVVVAAQSKQQKE
jgi:predicted neutral ceramidase superfamily lipid hydrolase